MKSRQICKECARARAKHQGPRGGMLPVRWYHTDTTWHLAPRMRIQSFCGLVFTYDKRGFPKHGSDRGE